MRVCRPPRGSRALMSLPAAEHATIVQRWIDAGLVIFGKTNTPEFGAKGITEPVAWGPARNPWDLQRTPGGSSGGSAAAVAAGIVPCAGANDGGGSIRIPAACCGLVGLKPGRGLTPVGPGDGRVHARRGGAGRRVPDGARHGRDARRHQRRRTVRALSCRGCPPRRSRRAWEPIRASCGSACGCRRRSPRRRTAKRSRPSRRPCGTDRTGPPRRGIAAGALRRRRARP